MGAIFNEVLLRPIFNLLVFLYSALGNDFGLAIIAATILVRVVVSPLSIKTTRSQQALAKLNPQVEEIRKKITDPAAQSQAIMRLYKEHKVSPLSGCLPLLIQLPIIIALYKALLAGFKPESASLLYGFINNPGTINPISFGFLNVTSPNHILAFVAGAFQWVQAKVAMSTQQQATPSGVAGALNNQMLYLFPLMLVVISWNLAAGITVYFIASAIVAVIEQWLVRRALAPLS
ncbi:MAG: YidC/Oxa1 family membrane protein insertase [Patescibacteria group bacterium]|mgnify:CR=1 FL=1